jgi:rRNA maturation protein Nop10
MFETLAKVMGPADTLKITCGACGHRAEFTRPEAFARSGPDASPYIVRRRATCAACGERRRIGAGV